MEIQKVCILGAGNLGSRVALQSAISGYQVTVYDIDPNAFENAKKTMSKILYQLEKEGIVTKEDSTDSMNRIHFTLDVQEAVNEADIINESVLEDVEIKQKVWTQFGEIAPEKTIFTTNTSYLLPSMFASFTGRPEKFCALHFHDVFYSRVVDIMPHLGTDPTLIPLLEEFGKSLNQVPVLVKKENHGYIFNSMLMAFVGAAGKLLTNDVANISDIDKSWMVNFHMPMGPFGILDSVGLDTAWHVTRNMPDKSSQAFAALLKTYIDAGKLGEKSGEGFYSYPKPSYRDADFLR
ncbi:3-hydroxybutyryl-CoA dehydrogenase [Rhodonellum psychrophilum GCM71 = DSM 17998]|uniref:3-hydroxybutyryl-CoA dehydrogenase n=2 Tax=Rhodonellum TaxID=336827 RepID=U5BZK3_9BACT|nr:MULTISPECIES: 3-hydroxyacyl-CoA dehydrogenase [Rhodonellum]ERM83268.1 3-hydroxybutyryl-CoA dehydrogenase [Rhodonellum psychrophilum GCM71 = DSM 17998]SDZ50477.1 3-hydroxybutyryl-CoA dehydrogenase [Rhodonellum ikkaensis]